MKAKVGKTLNFLLQIAIILVAYGFIYKKVFLELDFEGLVGVLTSKSSEKNFHLFILLAFVLIPLNLGIEAQKWRFLIGKFEHVPFFRALKAVFSGVTVSVFTPNRVGEYFGRVFILKSLHPFKGVLLTFVGSMGQLLATIIMGSLAGMLFLPKLINIYLFPNHLLIYGAVIAILLTVALLVLLYLNFSLLPVFLKRIIPGIQHRFSKYTGVFECYSSGELTYVLFLSILRYFIFTTQFILLLLAFGIKMPFTHYIVVIPVIFFVMTVIPTIALSELGIRGSVSIYFIGLYLHGTAGVIDLSAIGIIAASTLLWLFNLAIPAFTGTFFIFNLRFIRNRTNRNGQ